MQLGGSGATSGRQGQRFLHDDNAPSQTSLVQQFLADKNISVITQPPYSPVLYSEKRASRGARFKTVEDIKSRATAELWKVPKESFCPTCASNS
jgi:hypothetical protein